MKALEVLGLKKSFAAEKVLRGVDLSVAEGEIYGLFGPSGCGKTTLLRTVAGLESPDSGEIQIFGQTVFGAGQCTPSSQRQLSMVYQDPLLFPHLSNFDNVWIPARERGVERSFVEKCFDLLKIGSHCDKSPLEISGGQQQRVALARALAVQPRLLLLDEPFANLDAFLKADMLVELKTLLKKMNITVIFVSHDCEEVYLFCDRLCVMAEGKVLQEGTPEEVYRRPVSVEVAQRFGRCNLWPGHSAGVRPEDLFLRKDPSGEGEVKEIIFKGASTLILVLHPLASNGLLIVEVADRRSTYSVGDRVSVETVLQ